MEMKSEKEPHKKSTRYNEWNKANTWMIFVLIVCAYSISVFFASMESNVSVKLSCQLLLIWSSNFGKVSFYLLSFKWMFMNFRTCHRKNWRKKIVTYFLSGIEVHSLNFDQINRIRVIFRVFFSWPIEYPCNGHRWTCFKNNLWFMAKTCILLYRGECTVKSRCVTFIYSCVCGVVRVIITIILHVEWCACIGLYVYSLLMHLHQIHQLSSAHLFRIQYFLFIPFFMLFR